MECAARKIAVFFIGDDVCFEMEISAFDLGVVFSNLEMLNFIKIGAFTKLKY